MKNPDPDRGPHVYTGGGLETNAYLIPGETGWLCFDAPEGLAEEARRRRWKIEALFLTHGHFDHVWDAWVIEAEHGCPVYVHPADAPLLRDISYLKMFGIRETFPLVQTLSELPVPDRGSLQWTVGEREFTLFHIPGHSLGSVAFYEPEESRIFGGDVLFAGGVGRWDLPGGSREALISGITRHLLFLPEATEVWPGHGPGTTIGREKASNPYLPR
jgi:glyoxylase-like metal-dependent hydrolase (beta-lactamase superfamily II)